MSSYHSHMARLVFAYITYFLAALVLLLPLYPLIATIRAWRKLQAILAAREAMSIADLYEMSGSRNLIDFPVWEQAWRDVASILSSDPSKLRPDDSLQTLCCTTGLLDANMDAVMAHMRIKTKRSNTNRVAPLSTLNDVVCCCANPDAQALGFEIQPLT